MWPFLLLALLLTWPLQILAFTAGLPASVNLGLLALAGLGPSIAALVMTRGAVLGELRRRPPARLALLALAGPSVLVGIAVLAHGVRPDLALPFWGAVIWPPFGEELGWRGYLYPRLADRHGALAGALGTGLAWATWHIPTAIGPTLDPPIALLFLAGIVVISVPIAWLQERGGRSVWLAIFAHAGMNGVIFVRDPDVAAVAWRVALFALAAAFAARSLRTASAPDRR